MNRKSLAIVAAFAALPFLGATGISADKASPTPVHYRATQWAMIESGEHVGETFALTVFDGADSETIDYGMSEEDCAEKRALLAGDVHNEFACIAERSI